MTGACLFKKKYQQLYIKAENIATSFTSSLLRASLSYSSKTKFCSQRSYEKTGRARPAESNTPVLKLPDAISFHLASGASSLFSGSKYPYASLAGVILLAGTANAIPGSTAAMGAVRTQ